MGASLRDQALALYAKPASFSRVHQPASLGISRHSLLRGEVRHNRRGSFFVAWVVNNCAARHKELCHVPTQLLWSDSPSSDKGLDCRDEFPCPRPSPEALHRAQGVAVHKIIEGMSRRSIQVRAIENPHEATRLIFPTHSHSGTVHRHSTPDGSVLPVAMHGTWIETRLRTLRSPALQ
jgi:hypothetical protein